MRPLTLLVLLSLWGARPAAAEPGPVALLPLLADGLAADEIGPLERVVRSSVDRHYGARSVGGVLERLSRGGATGLRCDRTDPACSAQLGAVCDAAQVIVARYSQAGAASQLSFQLVDVDEATQLAFVAGPVTAGLKPDEVVALLTALDRPSAARIELNVTGPRGAALEIDGKPYGALPVPTIDDIEPGPHTVVVLGEERFETTVEVRRGEPALAAAPVPTPARVIEPSAPTPPPPPSSPGPLLLIGGASAAGLGVIAGGIGLFPLVSEYGSASRLADLEARVAADPSALDDAALVSAIGAEHASLESNGEAWRTWGLPVAIAGGALLVTGIGLVVTGAVLPAD